MELAATTAVTELLASQGTLSSRPAAHSNPSPQSDEQEDEQQHPKRWDASRWG